MNEEELIGIADKIGIAVNEIYRIYLAAQPVKATVGVFIFISYAISMYIIWKSGWMEDEEEGGIRLMYLMVCGMVVAFLYLFMYHILLILILPEYSALEDIFG